MSGTPRPQSTDRIGCEEIIVALRRSGYLIEQHVRSILEQRRYYTEANPAYPDPESGKSREYDVSTMGAVRLYRKKLE
jgi:hypothetical protein